MHTEMQYRQHEVLTKTQDLPDLPIFILTIFPELRDISLENDKLNLQL